jgi:hypothetical protein
MTDVTCIHCYKDFEICHDDGAHCEDGQFEQEQCPHCGKYMMISTRIVLCHEEYDAPCLNKDTPDDKDHIWSTSYRLGKVDSMKRVKTCRACGLKQVFDQ